MFPAIRDIRCAKGRFALMGGVVALISLLLVMLSGLTAGLGDQSTSAIEKLGTINNSGVASKAVDTPGTNEPKASFTESEVTTAQVDAWKNRAGAESVEPLGISQSRLQATTDDGGSAGGTTNVAVFGVEPDGRFAPSRVAANTVVIGRSVAEALSLGTGGQKLRALPIRNRWGPSLPSPSRMAAPSTKTP